MKPLVLYHAGCSDGFAAAWSAWRRFGGAAEYRPVSYGDVPPVDVDDREVYILDFSYPLTAVERIAKASAKLVLLDHHKTAYDALIRGTPRGFGMACKANDTITIVPDRSGAQLAYDFFGDGTTDWAKPGSWPEVVIAYVADRDLWQWKLPESREVNAYLRSLPHDFTAWDRFMEPTPDRLSLAIIAGQAILQAQAREIERAVRRARRLDSLTIPTSLTAEVADAAFRAVMSGRPMVVNVTENVSEVLEALSVEPPHWAIGWYQAENGRYRYSLRASPEGPDVAKIAEAFGGGGHARASGFEATSLLF